MDTYATTLRLSQLYSEQTSARLSVISSLRSRGIGEHIPLPQLVVCGDQSTGKSSVLEGITGIPFPRRDGLCTRFATEITLEHIDAPLEIIATIIPSPVRDDSSKSSLQGYRSALDTFDGLQHVIDEAGELMGLRGYGQVTSGPSFGKDVLRIRVTGPTKLSLSIVDLPGLISVPNEEQTEEDVKTVHTLVDTYVSNARTIILAVVQAGNDIANQSIIQKSKTFDRAGLRTIGIITKPDLINAGTERRIAALARNEDTTKLKLGFFLVKNPAPMEVSNSSAAPDRDDAELAYFTSHPWHGTGLDLGRVGVRTLRSFLHRLLDEHTERELPNVREEVRTLLRTTQKEIDRLGQERPTASHVRVYLSRLAMQFHALCIAALRGDYHGSDAVFFADGSGLHRRLRACIHSMNTNFSDTMRMKGESIAVKVSSGPGSSGPGSEGNSSADSTDDEDADHLINRITEQSPSDPQIRVSNDSFARWVRKVHSVTRGQELPGNYNHVLLSELFHVQSRRWSHLAECHVHSVLHRLRAFVKDLSRYIASGDERVAREIDDIVVLQLDEHSDRAESELISLLGDERQQPITYNHYYTDNVQRARQSEAKQLIHTLLKDAVREDYNNSLHISNNGVDSTRFVNALQKRVTVDMDAQACAEARAGLDAYYKVARKTFVDNVCKQIVERHLLRPLSDLFSPETVASYSEDELMRIAAESSQVTKKRDQLRELQFALSSSLRELAS